jgi:hypothetical protein
MEAGDDIYMPVQNEMKSTLNTTFLSSRICGRKRPVVYVIVEMMIVRAILPGEMKTKMP